MAAPNDRYLYSTIAGDVFETYRTGVFVDAGIALLRLNEYARRASGEKKDFRLAGPAKASTDRARLLYLQALAHLHSYLIAVSPGARSYFFERLLPYAESAAKLNGVVGLLASAAGHFFLIGETEKCREIRRILLTKWNLFSPDADIAPFLVASHCNRLISFMDSAQLRLFVDCVMELSEELPAGEGSRELPAHGLGAMPHTMLHGEAYPVELVPGGSGPAGPANSDAARANGSLVSLERRADLLGAFVAATGLSFGQTRQQSGWQDRREAGDVFEICPGVCVRPAVGGLHDKGLWLDLELGPQVYELTHEDRQAICIEIVSILSGAVRAIAGAGSGSGPAVVMCPLIWSSADHVKQPPPTNEWRIERAGRDTPEEARTVQKSEGRDTENEAAEWSWELGPDEDVGDIPDILGIKVEKLATNVGKGMGSFVTHRGKCYQLAEWPRSGGGAVTTFFDEQRQREIIAGALQACVGAAAEARSSAGILDPATEESSRRFVWRFEAAS